MIYFEANDDIEKLIIELNQFEEKLKHKVVRSGLVSLARPVKKSMKANAPQDDGDLAKSINHKLLNKRQKSRLSIDSDEVAILVGPNKKVNGFHKGFIANFIEDGVKPHSIKAIKKHDKTMKFGSGDFFSGEINHPGIKANPFMERSIDQNDQNFEELFYKGMARTLDKIRAQ